MMSSVSLILLAMFTTANVAGPGGQHLEAAMKYSMLAFLIASALMAVAATYIAIPRGRRSYKVTSPARTGARGHGSQANQRLRRL
jgi:hypothetical protein